MGATGDIEVEEQLVDLGCETVPRGQFVLFVQFGDRLRQVTELRRQFRLIGLAGCSKTPAWSLLEEPGEPVSVGDGTTATRPRRST